MFKGQLQCISFHAFLCNGDVSVCIVLLFRNVSKTQNIEVQVRHC